MGSVPYFLLLFTGTTIFAAWRGAGPERSTSAAFVAALVGSATAGLIQLPGGFRSVPLQVFAVDCILLALLIVIAMKANRWWTIPVAGCQLVAVLVHTGKLIDLAMIPNGYVFLVTIWSWPMVIMLAVGTWSHRRRLAEGIIVPDWKPSSAPRRYRMPS